MHTAFFPDVATTTFAPSPARTGLRRVRRTLGALALCAVSTLPLRGQTTTAQYGDIAGPVGSALDTIDGVTYLYVTDESRGQVVKIDTATGAKVATFGTAGSAPGQFGRPYGVAVDPVSHDLYVAERANGRVQRIDENTGASVFMWGINDAAFNGGQNTNPPNPSSPQGRFQEPVGVAADAAGNVYVVDHGNNRVQKFRVGQNGGAWTAEHAGMWGTTGSGNGQFDRPYGAALDGAGNLWVADGLNGRVQRFDPNGAHLLTVGAPGAAPGQFIIATGVGFDSGGSLYVTSTNSDPQNGGAADANNQWVSQFTIAGNVATFVSRFGGAFGADAGQFRLPFSVVVDGTSRAYVTDYYNGRVQVVALGAPGDGGTDATPPTVTAFTVAAATATSATYQLTFSEAVTGVEAEDFTLVTAGGATANLGPIAGSGAAYSIPVTFTGTGTVQLNLDAEGTEINDAAGNALAAGATGPVHTIGTATGGGDGGTGGGGASAIVAASVPAAGVYRAGDALVVKVRFSGPVHVVSEPRDAEVGPQGRKDNEKKDKKDKNDDERDKDEDPASGKPTKDDGSDDVAERKNQGGDENKEKASREKDDDEEDDDTNGEPADGAEGRPSIGWSAVGGSDSGVLKYQSGTGTAELTFKYQVRGNDAAPQGIRWSDAIRLPAGVALRDGEGRVIPAERLVVPWPENPLAGIILVRANESNPGHGRGDGGHVSGGENGPGAGKGRKRGKLVNLSSRLRINADEAGAVIVGFVVAGGGEQSILIRAVGPTLANFGVSDAMTSPELQVRDVQGRLVAANRGWSNDSHVAAIAAQLGAFGLTAGSRDAAVLVTLTPGAYTATVLGGSGTTLVELYDGDAARAGGDGGSQLANVSTRAVVQPGSPLITGFVVSGDSPKQVLVRAAGPALHAFGVDRPLDDPEIEIRDSTGALVAANDDWAGGANTAAVAGATTRTGAFPLPEGGRDAALVVTVPPGTYTVVVTGNGSGSGAALVEVYELAE